MSSALISAGTMCTKQRAAQHGLTSKLQLIKHWPSVWFESTCQSHTLFKVKKGKRVGVEVQSRE